MNRKLFWFPLALLAALTLAASASAGTADAPESASGIAILKAQRFDEATAFDPDTAADASGRVVAGDVIVLTIGFQNNSGITEEIAGFGVKLLCDSAKVSPYVGAAPFHESPSAFPAELKDEYGWMCIGSAKREDNVNASGVGTNVCAVRSGASRILVRMAFQCKADMDDALEPFSLDPKKTKVVNALLSRKPLTLDVRGASGEKLSAESLRDGAEILPEIGGSAPESPAANLCLVMYDSQGKMIDCQRWEADLSKPITAVKTDALPQDADASRAKFILFGENCTPLAAQALE